MQRILRWFSLIASLAAVAVLLVIPFYSGVTVHQSAGGRPSQSTHSATLLEGNGSAALLILSIPVLAAVSALVPWPPKYRRILDVLGAVIVTLFSLLGAFTVGLFFLPTAAALLIVALWPRRSLPAT